MSESISPAQAQEALTAAERGRERVIAEVGMPAWYWWALALGWIGIGVVVDLDRPWVTAAATFVFGAVHAAMYQFVAGGRYRNPRLSVRADAIGLPVSLVVIGSLIVLAGLTIVTTLLLIADGARHPATLASVFVATVVLLGGPAVMAWMRRRALRSPLR